MAVDVQLEDDIREIEGLVGGYLRSPQDEATRLALLAELEKFDDQTARADAYSNFKAVLVRYQVPSVQRRAVQAVVLGRGVGRVRCGQQRARRQKRKRGCGHDCAEPHSAIGPGGCPGPRAG